MIRFLPVERVHRPSRATFDAALSRPRRPGVLTGRVADWPAMARWSRQYFKERIGAVEVPVEVRAPGLPRGYFHADREKGFIVRQMTVAEMIDVMDSTPEPEYYMRGVSIRRQAPELLADLGPLEYIDAARHVSENFWVGPRDAISPLHYDVFDAFLIQIRGRKRVVLFDSRDRWRMYPRSTFSVSPHMSDVYLELGAEPDYRRFPRLRGATGYEVVLAPGEMLFIPAGWWHQVWSLDEAISINYWWKHLPFRYLHPLSLRLIPGFALKTARRRLRRLVRRGDSHIQAGSSISEQHYL